jgi:RNA polymerase sigma factor (sigma-70 family)
MPLDDMSDEQLMLACRYGNRGAFALLFEKYRGPVFHFARRMCGDETVAEELNQDVFLKVAASAGRYEPTTRFRTWLFTIARNACLNSFRRPRMASLTASVADPRPDDPAAAVSKAEREARVDYAQTYIGIDGQQIRWVEFNSADDSIAPPEGNGNIEVVGGPYGARNYIVKSNSWQGGALSFTADSKAYFTGKCVIQQVDLTTGAVVVRFAVYVTTLIKAVHKA